MDRRIDEMQELGNGEINEENMKALKDFVERKQADQPLPKLSDRLNKLYIQEACIVATTASMCGADPIKETHLDWVSHRTS